MRNSHPASQRRETSHIASRLRELRTEIEDNTGKSLSDLRIGAAALFDDVGRALGLDDDQIRGVLGGSATAIFAAPSRPSVQQQAFAALPKGELKDA